MILTGAAPVRVLALQNRQTVLQEAGIASDVVHSSHHICQQWRLGARQIIHAATVGDKPATSTVEATGPRYEWLHLMRSKTACVTAVFK